MLETAPSFVDQAEAAIRRLILEGSLKPGERVNEVQLAADLGISRSPLREALQRLATKGLVRYVPRRGAHVASFDAAEVSELLEMREALDVMAARLAARRRTEQDLVDFTALLDSTETELEDGGATTYPSKRDFHSLLLRATRNARLEEAATGIYAQIQLARELSGAAPSRARQALEEHRAILRAVEARDEDAAAAAASRHLRESLRSMKQILQIPDEPGTGEP